MAAIPSNPRSKQDSTPSTRITSLPEEILIQILSWVPRSYHLSIVTAIPLLRSAIVAQEHSVITNVDLTPTTEANCFPPASPRTLKDTLQCVLTISGPDLRVLRLHSGLSAASTASLLGLVQRHCNKIEQLSFYDGGTIDRTIVQPIFTSLTYLRKLSIADAGSEIISVLNSLTQKCETISLLGTRTPLLGKLLKSLGYYSNQKSWKEVSLLIGIAETGNRLVDAKNCSLFFRDLEQHGASFLAFLAHFEIRVTSSLYDESFQNRMEKIFNSRRESWTFIPAAASFRLHVHRNCSYFGPCVDEADTTTVIKCLTLNYERLLHDHMMGLLEPEELHDLSDMEILSTDGETCFTWPAQIPMQDLQDFQVMLRQHVECLHSVRFNCQVQHGSARFHFVNRPARLAVEWAHRLLLDFPSIRKLSCPRMLMLYIQNPFVYVMFRACENIETLHLLEFRGQREGTQSCVSILEQQNELESMATFFELIGQSCAKLTTIFLEASIGRMFYSDPSLSKNLDRLVHVLDDLEIKRPGLDISSVRVQIEDWKM